MRPINHFLAWAAGEGEAVTAKARLPRLPKRLIDVLTRDEVQALEDAAQTDRDRLVVRVLADTGIRVGELVGLRSTDLATIGRDYFLKVRGKGARERFVPVPPRLHRRLEQYVTKQRPRDTRSDRLFLSARRGPTGAYDALTESGVGQLLPTLAEQAGLKKRVYPHLLRHSFATWALTKGMNPMSLAKIMGHSSLVMIQQVYAHLTPADSYEALMKILSDDK
jgi:site-specific recombinase XerD